MEEKSIRIAIVDKDKCKPNKCALECKKKCPIVYIGKLCVEVKNTDKIATISESLCTGCGLCVKACPFSAIKIIKLPVSLVGEIVHRYGESGFRLYRLPMMKCNQILGIIGDNGMGKSTILKILGGKLIPNMGNYKDESEWLNVQKYYRGSELQMYFDRLINKEEIKSAIKSQYVDLIPRSFIGERENMTVREFISERFPEWETKHQLVVELDILPIIDRPIKVCSGGELQRFAILVTCLSEADVYMFDEFTSFLDIKQRIKACSVIQSLEKATHKIIVEHDLAILDFLSDYVCCIYGKESGFGVVTKAMSNQDGINQFLDGFLIADNMRFRDEPLHFKLTEIDDEEIKKRSRFSYPPIRKTLDNFKLRIEAGEFTSSEVTMLMGENGTGKTTFIKLLAGILEPDDKECEIPQLSVSYKPQILSPKWDGTVNDLLYSKLPGYSHPQFQSDVVVPLKIAEIKERLVKELSGGELQRVAIVLCLGKPADIYLIDEPSAYLDVGQRISVSKIIKRFILHSKKSAFIVEHDFMMASYLADKVILFDGIPTSSCVANRQMTPSEGINTFLKNLNVTYRRDAINFRPRINKFGSVKDREQKESGIYYAC